MVSSFRQVASQTLYTGECIDINRGVSLYLKYPQKKLASNILNDSDYPIMTPVLAFGKNSEDEWRNRIYWGDNLLVLRALKHDAEMHRQIENAGGIKLAFIDPPFGTGDVYDAKGVFAYSAKMQGSEFIEFLRERALLIHDILAEDGCFYIKIDYHYGHYVKVVLDEIFGVDNFRNEIVINRRRKSAQETKRYNVANDVLLFYSKSDDFKLDKEMRKRKCTFCGEAKAPEWHAMISSGIRNPPERTILGETMLPPRNMHWTYRQEKIDQMTREGRIRINEDQSFVDLEGNRIQGLPQYLQAEDVPVDSSWTDLKGYTWRWKYPTEVAEEILQRVIAASSTRGDVMLDVFAGSGTTGAVAEKMGRRWIMADASKMSIHVITKRLLSLKEKIGNTGKPLRPRPFIMLQQDGYGQNSPPTVICSSTSQDAVTTVSVEDVRINCDDRMPQDVQSQREGLEYVMTGSTKDGIFTIESFIDRTELKKKGWNFEIADDIPQLIFKDVFGNSVLHSIGEI